MKSDMHELRQRIKARTPSLTASQKRIANFIVANPQKFALSSIRQLEEELHTSKSTIVRLAQALGYNGFHELKSLFLTKIRHATEPIPRYKSFLASSEGDLNFLKLMVDETLQNIDDSFSKFDEESYKKAIAMLEKANHVYIIGKGLSSHVAQISAYLFTRISIKSSSLTHGGLSFTEQIITLGPDDLILAFSFPPYSSETFDAVQYAHERKLKIISITDHVTNKVVQFSDVSLEVKVDSVTISNSIMSVLVLIYSIVTQIGYDRKNETLQAIEAIEQLRKEKTY